MYDPSAVSLLFVSKHCIVFRDVKKRIARVQNFERNGTSRENLREAHYRKQTWKYAIQ